METMYYIGLDVHKKTISYCVKDGSGQIHAEGAILHQQIPAVAQLGLLARAFARQ